MARGSGSPFSGAPRRVPGSPASVPGAPHYVPGGPPRTGIVPGSRIRSGFQSFQTTVGDQPSATQWRDIHTRQIRDFQGRFAGPWGMAWQGLDSISETFFALGTDMREARERAMAELAKEMVEWGRENAPWEDETGAARQGLQAVVVTQGSRTTIWFGHGKDIKYGVWLEIMQNGSFAIVFPTVLHFAPQVAGRVVAQI